MSGNRVARAESDTEPGLTGLGPTVPGWSLRAVFAAIALPLALVGVPDGPWPVVAAALTAVTVAVPRWLTAWVLIGVVAFSSLLGPGALTPRLLALIAGAHALHLVGSWLLVVPAGARLQPAVLLPSLRRFILVQIPVQAAAVILLLVDRGAVVPWLAAVAGLAIAGVVGMLLAPLLRRPPR